MPLAHGRTAGYAAAARPGCRRPDGPRGHDGPHGDGVRAPRVRRPCQAGAVLAERLGHGATAAEVLRRLGARATRRGDAPPAALLGEWFGVSAVIAPECRVEPVEPERAFGAGTACTAGTAGCTGDPGGLAPSPDAPRPRIGGGWIGYLSYPDG